MPQKRKHTSLFTTRRIPADEPKQIVRIEDLPHQDPFEGLVQPIEAYAEDLLRNAHLPPWNKEVRVLADGSWRDDLPNARPGHRQEHLNPGESIGCASDILEGRGLINSQEWYAAEILRRIEAVRCFLAHRSFTWENVTTDFVPYAVSHALSLGVLVAMVDFKFTWELDAVRGMRVKEAASQGGTTRADKARQEHAEWQTAADALWTKQPTASRAQVARKLSQQFGKKPNTIRQKIHKPKSC